MAMSHALAGDVFVTAE